MSEIRALIQQIRYSLNNLSAQNGHHEFEAICRHFSRKRLGLNIIPATGPVSAGGDQGRDFETYEILPELVSKNNKELVSGSASFACTIQKDGIPTKIKSDVKTIIEKGGKVDIIYIFSLNNLVLSKRHEIQKWAQDTHSVKLEIFDGEFLAENLADRDLFWIAIEFLQIPASLYPVSDDIDYLKTKEKWEKITIDAPNYAIFDDLRNLGRRCLFDKSTKQDILFWISKLEELLKFDFTQEFKRKVLYEIIALRIRGTGSLAGWEKYIRQYFDLSNTFNNQVEAQEACVVVSYAYGSMIRGSSDCTEEEIKKWRKSISDYADGELKKDYPKTIQATIYELKGYLLLTNPYDRRIDEGLEWWLKLAELIKDTPLFPLERFSDVLVRMIDYIGNNKKYEELNQIIDELLGKRVGGFAVADKCRDRSIAYREKGELLKSLKELHKATVEWYSHETLYGSLLSMLLIAETYHSLGLLYAAKQYAMAVVFIASRAREEENKVFIPQGLSALAEYEYSNGEWAHFIEHAEFALRALSLYTKGHDDKYSEKIYEIMPFYASLVYAFTDIFDKGDIMKYADTKIKTLSSDIIGDIIPMAKDMWEKKKTEDVLHKIQSEFQNYPFNDVGKERNAKFDAFGISFTFSWVNGLLETAKSEQLISILQILLAASIEEELYLLKTDVLVEINIGDSIKVENKLQENKFKWLITLPREYPTEKEERKQYQFEVLAVAIQILSEVSLLPSKRISELLKKLFKEGFMSRAFAGNSYEVLFLDVVPKELYEEIIVLPEISYLKELEFGISVHKLLKWKDSPIKEINKEQSRELIKKRYERSIVPIRLTLKKLKVDTSFQAAIKKLRAEGWKDWHILMATASIVVNYRVNIVGHSSFTEMNKIFMEHMKLEEIPESIEVPLIEFEEEKLRDSLFMTMPSTIKIIGLEYKAPSFVPVAFQEFLDKRCGYFSDDIPHEDYFG